MTKIYAPASTETFNWYLSDLFPISDSDGLSPTSPKLRTFIADLTIEIEGFHLKYKHKLAKLDGVGLCAALESYERICAKIARLSSFAELLYSVRMNQSSITKFQGDCSELVSGFEQKLMFFTLELAGCAIEPSPTLAKFNHFIAQITKQKPHQLDESTEQLLNELSLSSGDAMVRLYDETLANLRFMVDDQELTEAETLQLFHHADGDKRFKAAKALGFVLGQHEYLFAIILNAIIKEGLTMDKKRAYPHYMAARNLENEIEETAVQNLESAVMARYPSLSHRYYALKAKMMGKPFLPYWDRLAPVSSATKTNISINDAQSIVLAAYGKFSPKMAEIAGLFFQHGWIDWHPKVGKASGAFSHATSVDVHPYILLNFHGTMDCVMTLAHELGHGVHQYLARGVGQLEQSSPLTLAETASIFGEMLVFDHLMAGDLLSAEEKRALTIQKIEDGLNTIVRQIAFLQFERQCHELRQSGELTVQDFERIWLSVSQDSLGTAVHFDADFNKFWCYISHFFHAPFYVYSYAFGDLLTRALYQQYKESPDNEKSEFVAKYLNLLSAGGSQSPEELLKPFSFDLNAGNVWNLGLNQLSLMIEECERGMR